MNPFGVAQRNAAEFAAWNRANRKARIEHARTRVDHALPFRCHVCTVGTLYINGRPTWAVAGDLLFCGHCKNLTHAKRAIAEAEAAPR